MMGKFICIIKLIRRCPIYHRDHSLVINGALESATLCMDELLYWQHCMHVGRIYASVWYSIVKTWRSSKLVCHLHPSNHHSPTKDPSLSWQPSAWRVSSPCQRRAPSQPVPAGHRAPRRRAVATSTVSELWTACKFASDVSVVCRIRFTRSSFTFHHPGVHPTVLHSEWTTLVKSSSHCPLFPNISLI